MWGGAAWALAAYQRHEGQVSVESMMPFYQPSTPLAFARSIRTVATSATDVSDGLAKDLRACLGQYGAEIDRRLLPYHPSITSNQARYGLEGGEDYGLLFTAPSSSAQTIDAMAKQHDIMVTCIGKVLPSSEQVLIGENGRECWSGKGYDAYQAP